MSAWVLSVIILTSTFVTPQQKPTVDPHEVDKAIKKGVDYLKIHVGQHPEPPKANPFCRRELILLAWTHAGVSPSDPEFRKMFTEMTESELLRTYCVSLQAMVLEEVDRVTYQRRLWQCAQFLVDNQNPNGRWSYGEPTLHVEDVPTPTPVKGVATPATKPSQAREFEPKNSSAPRPKPPIRARLVVSKKRDGPSPWDHSNSQYAALGLRACHDAGIVLPKEVIERAQRSWKEEQLDTGDRAEGRGWSYMSATAASSDQKALLISGSMTAGAVGSLAIYHYLAGEPWTQDKAIVDGLKWLAGRFTVEKNPGAKDEYKHQYYYLYGLERAGILYGTDRLGRHDWYAEGAQYLLKMQQPDGSWGTKEIWDTCFAILFLRRATRPLVDVETKDRFNKR